MISELITPGDIKVNLDSTERDESFAELLEIAAAKNPEINRTQALNALLEREAKMSTAVYPFVAVPHVVLKNLPKTIVSVGIDRRGIEFDSIDSKEYNPVKVNVIFEIFFDEKETDAHLNILRDILQLASNPDFVKRIKEASNQQEAYDIIAELEA